jgi:hypothetical protein
MKIVVTAREIIDVDGAWEEFCADHGINLYARREGLMGDDEEFVLTLEQAERYRLIPRRGGV